MLASRSVRSISLQRVSAILRQLRMSSTAAGSEDDALFEKINSTGIITLNRPKALNALDLSMVKKITPKLKEWCEDPSTSVVIIKGSGDKAFCAGGDIKAVTEAGKSGDPQAGDFFKNEYVLNYTIGTMKKPYIAFIHGITMGGGVGLSVHGRYRVATEKTLFAMPETAIGLFPDVGGGYFLPRLDGKLGIYLALTGYRLKGRDVLHAGVATHFVEAQRLPELEQELCSLQSAQHAQVQEVLNKFHEQCTIDVDKPFSLAPHKSSIDRLFDADTVEAILQNLEQDGSEWAIKQLETLKKMSPTSMKITLRQLLEGGKLTLGNCLSMEYRIAEGCIRGHDFYEGVRAVLIDKDHTPKWSPATLEGVGENIVTSHFSPLGKQELIL
ncbi:3-hydroxyisobutyryl-CoA hydrolase, mitochondrial-like isoform X1 [Lytechinus variegatus]|uniref:3-hydroxyisobutyryl-CoA hydrolase, mitochondrial-like isoform X1 n=1 Tax=Lytechinus variegatus TaxID=7654 RepID=UPI001BB12704|nr:3-hydroxyisobutyryl-CoA hydrolase, mitochondrial-like isoform X1 [Lytechinus variegatus]